MYRLFQKGRRTGVLFPVNRKFAKMFHISQRLFFVLLFICTNATGQERDMPAVVKPSPQSTAFTRYGDYPMTGNNGLTDITIPIHTIVGRTLSLPITTSFHASGLMAC
jgi:hypothetical protein